jgi:hypothetical protein
MTHDPSSTGTATEFRLDHELVEAFRTDTLTPQDEGVLAEQVTRLLPYHATLPDQLAGDLSRVTAGLGGEHELLNWLAQYPGRPRLIAHLYRLIGLLDWYSADPAVISALREVRTNPLPPIVGAHLAPDTDSATLAGLAWAIETAVAQNQLNKATRLAMDTASVFEQTVRRANQADQSFGDLVEEVARLRDAIAEAHREL